MSTGGRESMRRAWPLAFVRALVLVLALPLVSAGALPFWAQLFEIEAPHVCHCAVERHDCVCARCNPDHDEMQLTTESLSGRCGDDDLAFPGKVFWAVLPPSSVLAPARLRRALDRETERPHEILALPPPTPPPRRPSSIA